MTEELIIDGQRVDMADGDAVTLNFASNLLGDISDIETNYSQTIKLPKTAHNMAVLDSPTLPAYATSFRGVYHSAQYRRNGVQIINSGYAVLLDCDDDYQIALYWGIKTKLQDWTDENADLSALGWEPKSGTKTWELDTVSSSISENGFTWALYNAGIKSKWFERLEIGRHPFVQTWILFNLICESLGITWNAGDEIKSAIQQTGIFLPTHNTDSAIVYTATVETKNVSSAYGYGASYIFTFEENDLFTEETETQSVSRGSYYYVQKITVNNDGTAMFQYNLLFKGSGSSGGRVYLTITQNGDTVLSKSVGPLSSTSSIYTISGGATFKAYEGDVFRVQCYYAGSTAAATIQSSSYFKFTPPSTDRDIEIGDTFPASYNMPDISQVDFFKAVCNMFGLCVMPDGDSLQLVTLDALFSNKANAVDWSDKLVWSGVPCEPSQTKFSLGDYASTNNFKYKEDDDVKTSADGSIKINDKTLDKSKDVVELPFSPSDQAYYDGIQGRTRQMVCNLYHYSWSDSEPDKEPNEISDDDMPDFNEDDVNPRIVQFVVSSSEVLTRFSPYLTFNTLLSTYYSTFKGLLSDMISIVEDFRLDEHDLLNLDFLKPVYLRQYGRFYGIVSIQTKSDGLCEVELAQLPLSTE